VILSCVGEPLTSRPLQATASSRRTGMDCMTTSL